MKIRPATLDDLQNYSDLLQQTYQSAYVDETIGLTADCFSKEIFTSQDTQKYLRSHLIDTSTQKTWLAFEEEKLVGSITCILNSESEAELTGFYVHPQYQGQGIGKKLYELAIKFAQKRDLLLDIYTHNTQTIKLYETWGWQLDSSRGDNGYFYRHWPEWPAGLQAKCMYMRLKGE